MERYCESTGKRIRKFLTCPMKKINAFRSVDMTGRQKRNRILFPHTKSHIRGLPRGI